MTWTLPHFPTDQPSLRVGDVILAEGDDTQTLREKLARIVLDEMYQFVGLLDTNGLTLEINRSALEGAGLKIEDIRGRPFWEARWFQVSRESVEAHRDYVQRARAGEFIRCDTEVYGRTAGEETIVVDYSLLPVRDVQGTVVFLLAEGRNITEKKRAEAEIARKSAELESLLHRIRQLDQLKSDLFANVSHELRTPLALILGPTEDLLADPALNQTQRRTLQLVHRNAATLLKHVNDLLDLAKRDAHKLELSYARVDLSALFRMLTEQFHALTPQRRLSFVVDAPAQLWAEVDIAKMERVILNLVSNAFKFTPPGGRIHCRLTGTYAHRALITVQDSGPGIPEDLRDAVFERFRQIEGGTTREHGGTGLGLAIAKEFVDLHGGTLGVTEAPGGGALFQAEIPLRAPKGRAVARASAHPTPTHSDLQGALAELVDGSSGTPDAAMGAVSDGSTAAAGWPHRARVLVVEDNPEMRRFIAAALSQDHEVAVASDGQEALALAAAWSPDLIVTDLMMPRMSGDRLVHALRESDELREVPVLVLSARDDDGLRTRLLTHSVQDYVTKPFSAQELQARVRNLTTMKLTRDALRGELASQSTNLTQLAHELIDQRRSLQQSEQRWAAMFDHSPVGIVLTAPDGSIKAANPAFCALLGRTLPQTLGISLDRLAPVEDRAAMRQGLARVLASEVQEIHALQRFQRLDGPLIWADISVSRVPAPDETETSLMLVAADVTERRRAEEALSQARNELARVARASTLGELAASIAHEVNQPLAAIVTNANASLRWMDQAHGEAEAVAAVHRILRDANRAGEVITRVRRFLRHGELRSANVHLAIVIDEVLDMIRKEVQAAGVEVHIESTSSDLEVQADAVQVQQVVLNLVLNALEALQTQVHGRRRVVLKLRSTSPDMVCIDVCDTGPGIEAAHVDQVFEAFHTTKPSGMGMGLAISRSIVEAHGGRLWLSANGPDGATFSFTLPVRMQT